MRAPPATQTVLSDRLACPVCHSELSGSDELRCSVCGRVYPLNDGVPDFTPRPLPDGEVVRRWPLWQQVERNGRIAYEHDPDRNLSVGERDDCRAFAAFADLDGAVLDVGCGPQELPAYAADFPGELFGIDPLLGDLPRRFGFVQGVGEYLPFREGSFDLVLFATSLDHMVDPRRALAEARRVVRADGSIALWFGERGERTEGPRETAEWYEGLEVPEGAVDRFHTRYLDRSAVEELVAEAGLSIADAQADSTGNVFVRART